MAITVYPTTGTSQSAATDILQAETSVSVTPYDTQEAISLPRSVANGTVITVQNNSTTTNVLVFGSDSFVSVNSGLGGVPGTVLPQKLATFTYSSANWAQT